MMDTFRPDMDGWQSLGPVRGVTRRADGVELRCGAARVRISDGRDGIVRVRLAPRGVFGRDHSWAVVARAAGEAANSAGEQADVKGRRPRAVNRRAGRLAGNAHRKESRAKHITAPLPPPELSIGAAQVTLPTAAFRVVIQKNPCRIAFHAPDGSFIAGHDPLRGMAWAGDEVRCWMRLHPDDRCFGLGERGGPLDHHGRVLVNWNHDAAEHEPWTDPLYQSHPFLIICRQGQTHGIFFDNAWRATFDLGKTLPNAYSFGAVGGEMNFYVVPGPDMKDVLRRYARLVGTQTLPPKWALGYQQCRWSYASAARVRGIARRLRRHRIPCDAIYFDIDYMNGYRCFTWDARRFPNPPALLRDLRRRGFRSVLIVDPGIKKERGYAVYDAGKAGRHFCTGADGCPYVGRVWPGESVFPDFTRAATRDWWGSLYRPLLNDGVSGIWNDMNEPADFSQADGTVPLSLRHDNDGEAADHRACHNIYGMQMARATYEGLRRLRPGERPFVLTRAGFSGVQRFASVWTGDNVSSWEHLRMSLPMLLNMGLCGLSFVGADIGGFRGECTAELYARWLQLGIFYPLCRTHTCGGLSKDAPEQDPTAYGEKWTTINRRTVELRYRLLPYLYTQMHESERTGLPVMRPLVLEFPGMDGVHRRTSEFMWGDRILVAPVLEAGAQWRTLRLPPGAWYFFDDGRRAQRVRGRHGKTDPANAAAGGGPGDEIRVAAQLDAIPMFARAGAVIPMRMDVTQHVEERPLEILTLAVFPGNGGGAYYQDDGISFAYREGAFYREVYRVKENARLVTLHFSARAGDPRFAPRVYRLEFRGRPVAPRSVMAAGIALPRLKRMPRGIRASGWWHDRRRQTLHVQLPWSPSGQGVLIRR